MGIMRTKKQGVLKDNSEVEINEGHYVELLDRTWVTMENLNNNLLQHPLGEYDNELRTLYTDAIDCLWEAYQLIGSKMDDNEKA